MAVAKDPLQEILDKAKKKYNLSVGRLSEIADDVIIVTNGTNDHDKIIHSVFPLGSSV